VTAAEKTANWRPSGWQLITGDEQKLLYVLMQPNAQEGSHKDPATEVWVYNVASKTRVRRMRLVRPGSSISLTHGAEPLLLVQAGQLLDVYDPQTGSLVRSMDLPGFHTRMQMEPLH
jgi:methylamine dehydrogenase heavy chain